MPAGKFTSAIIKMKIHEYQAKNILSKYGVAVPRGRMVESREEADDAALELFRDGATGVVVKAKSMPAAGAKAAASKSPNRRKKLPTLQPKCWV